MTTNEMEGTPTLKKGYHLLLPRILGCTLVLGGIINLFLNSPTAYNTLRKKLLMVSTDLLNVRSTTLNLSLWPTTCKNIATCSSTVDVVDKITKLEKRWPSHPK
jgi:hypothetical protein